MWKKLIFYSSNFDDIDCKMLKELNIYKQVEICTTIKDYISCISNTIILIIVSDKDSFSVKNILPYFPREKIPPFIHIGDLLDLKRNYYKKNIGDKHLLYSLENYLFSINVPSNSILHKALKYSLYIMITYNIPKASYKLLKLVSCFWNNSFDNFNRQLRIVLHKYLSKRNSPFLNNLLNKQSGKIYFLDVINYCYEKYTKSKNLFSSTSNPEYYCLKYYLDKNQQNYKNLDLIQNKCLQ